MKVKSSDLVSLFEKSLVGVSQEKLDEIGIGGDRLEMITMSAGMGGRFVQTATEFTDKIRTLGPNPTKRLSMDEMQEATG